MNDNLPPWPLLARYLANEATPDEQQTVSNWLRADKANQRAFAEIRLRWLQTGSLTQPVAPPSDPAAVWDRYIAPQLTTQSDTVVRPLFTHRTWFGSGRWQLAAAVAGLLLLAYGGYRQFSTDATPPQVAATTVGKRAMMILPDGSRVWLNADSRLEYPKKFTGSLREVRLRGEAFFDVTHNPRQPFVIRLATASVRVLGTSFNVRAYPGDATVKTTVVTGRVAFIPNPATQPTAIRPASDTTFILPNHHVTQAVQTLAVTEEPVVARNEVAWKDNQLVFDQTPMREVAQTLERWYGLPVQLTNAIADCPLTATFEGQSLHEVMDLMSRTGQFQYTLTTKNVRISGRPCR
ncbi:FecR domain-containing protein [Spirosoma spitsbergense]|uniref:FecR domain-containing protein n=1 Tax=Spirosoma spitsbergense TaxID=431554 RepID=UPI000369FB61|nr:FecR domain-containing protein [Spirosoma spitsbergense]